ncbi:hypothetical protein [Actinomadura violacea]|uniref:Uncharacterized protein n=1 Tax=Actinomadura violacea TaxID=2819934 RepID=A0ABS3S4T7_9ACTN|nr:hypothetical protein [Actinomadura violacea]MBO2464017.1 hypothetical protein [Actinomadura violacea]
MEDDFAGKGREDFLSSTQMVWEMLRAIFAQLPFIIGLPDLQVEDAESVSGACAALQRARDELIDVQPIPATLAALITEGALEILQCLLLVTHTEGRDLPEWHAELWYRSLNRTEVMCGRAMIALNSINELANRQEEPDQE